MDAVVLAQQSYIKKTLPNIAVGSNPTHDHLDISDTQYPVDARESFSRREIHAIDLRKIKDKELNGLGAENIIMQQGANAILDANDGSELRSGCQLKDFTIRDALDDLQTDVQPASLHKSDGRLLPGNDVEWGVSAQ